MKITEVNIINFYELSEEWQKEALDNLEDQAKETLFFEPDETANPKEHILWDLSECFSCSNTTHKGFIYNAYMGISNNTGMLLKISDCGTAAEYIII